MVGFVTNAAGKTFLVRGLVSWSNLHDKCQGRRPTLVICHLVTGSSLLRGKAIISKTWNMLC